MAKSSMFCVIAIAVTALLVSPGAACSQEMSVKPGTRIRITELQAGAQPRSGIVVAAVADTVVLKLDNGGATVAFHKATLSRLELSRGRKTNTARGSMIGRIVGVTAGVMAGLVTCDCSGDAAWTAVSVTGGIIAGGFGGAAIGGLIGSVYTTERWSELPVDRWRVSAMPGASGSFALTLSLKF